jgi:moderate conductance mechanosensitive channel
MSLPRPWPSFVLAALLLLAVATGSRAQTAPLPAPAAPPPASTADLEHLVATLQNDRDRQQLIAQLQALIAAQKGEEQKAAPPPSGWLDRLGQELDAIAAEIVAAAGLVIDAPRLVDWLETAVNDPAQRGRWLGIGGKILIIFGAALVAEWIAHWLLRRPVALFAGWNGGGWAMRLLQLLLAAVFEFVPVLVLYVAAEIVLPLTHPGFGTRHVSTVIIGAILWARGILAVARVALLSPQAMRLYTLGEETRNYLYIWVRRMTQWAVYGYALASASWWLGVPGAVFVLLLRGTVLVLAVLAVIFVLQNRRPIADWLRGAEQAADRARPGWRLLRSRLAETWHVLAIIYIVGTFGVWVVRIDTGLATGLRATALSVVIVVGTAVLVHVIGRLSRRGLAISPELQARFPQLERRANLYLPLLTGLATIVIDALAVLALLQAWGVDAFAWLGSATGSRVAGSATNVAVLLVGAVVLWEIFSAAIERYLTSLDGNGRSAARVRTLLPLLRTSVLVALVTIVGLSALAELGVNIAPLLAGAGVVGIAVGFGSQALVKDVITGLFILIEDTFAVGDIVDVGKGSGVIERISIRTIRLRDGSGNLQTIPFSEIATVRNMTRDYSYVLAEARVLLREDPDRVMAVLRQVGEEMAADPEWQPSILAPLELWGVDHFTDFAMVIQCRFKVRPARQWAVGREFYRRMKRAFDANGIELGSASQVRYLAPPVPASPAASASSASGSAAAKT